MLGPVALVCLSLGAAPVSDPGVLVDRVIAVVGEEVVTESELHVEARIALAYREGEEAATSPLASELLESLRGYVINQLVIMIHARRLGAAEVPQERLTGMMDQFRSRFTSYVAYQAFLRRYGIGEETVRRILRRDLRNELFINNRLRRLSAPLQQETTRRAAITEAVEKLVDDHAVDAERASRGDAEPIYHIPDKNRVHLDFHKNSLINHFAPGALVARVLVRQGLEDLSYDKVRKDTRFLSRLFKREFAYRVGSIFANVFDETLATLAVRGMLDAHEDGTIGVRDPENLQVLAGFLDSFVEAYWITSMTLRELRTFPLWEKELVTRAQDQARRAYLEGKIQRPEAVNSTLISSALKWFQDSGVITGRVSAKRKTLSLSNHYSGDALEKLIENIGRFV